MDEMTRFDQLRAKLKARQGKREYRNNVDALKAEIARLEANVAARAALAGKVG